MIAVDLPRLNTFDVWRGAARRLAGHCVAADQVDWRLAGDAPTLFDTSAPMPAGPSKTDINVPRDFPNLAKHLCASRAPGAFDLAYRLLRCVATNPRLLSNRADSDVAHARGLVKNVYRDMHKMKAFVRFREVTPKGANRRQFVSWFEPDHRIEELTASFFARRFADMDWVIVTPEVTTRFDAGDISHEVVARERMELSDETETLWRTYYANIFNPARLKISAMQSEMPKKYWKNLPEAVLIPDLIAKAEAQVAQMRATAPTLPPLRATKVLQRMHESKDKPTAKDGD